MYNRYVPQPDGSYRKSLHPDNIPTAAAPAQPQTSPVCHEDPEEDAPKQPKTPPCPHMRNPRPYRPNPPRQEKYEPCGIGVGSFLRQLLPRDFDTGDLIVILLLLLMSSDCPEDQNSALLTLALYLFL